MASMFWWESAESLAVLAQRAAEDAPFEARGLALACAFECEARRESIDTDRAWGWDTRRAQATNSAWRDARRAMVVAARALQATLNFVDEARRAAYVRRHGIYDPQGFSPAVLGQLLGLPTA